MTVVSERPVVIEELPQPVSEVGDASEVRPPRDRYIDTLRAVALVRVVVSHALGWVWLPYIFPSMGIMFALGGSLVASSLDRAQGNYWSVIHRRWRRLLPPVWVLGAILVPLMLIHQWRYNELDGSAPLSWQTLLFWIFPISDPPGSSWAISYVDPLWYVRAYLWFTLLSGALLWAFRRWPKRTFMLPVGVAAISYYGGFDHLSTRSYETISDLGIYGACWLLGFAHHDGRIKRLPLKLVLPFSAALIAAGCAYALTHPDPVGGARIDVIPFAQTLYGSGAALLLLRLHSSFNWLTRYPVLDRLVTVINARAVTIFLWATSRSRWQ